jgi:ATP-binding cassette subfamily B protein
MNSIPSLALWDRSKLPLLIEGLARYCGAAHTGVALDPPAWNADLNVWIEAASSQFGLDVQVPHVSLKELHSSLTHAGPALLTFPDGRFAGIIRVRGRKARLLRTDLGTIAVSTELLREELCAGIAPQFETDIDRLLQECGTTITDPNRLRHVLSQQCAGRVPINLGWQMRARTGSSFRQQLIAAGVHRQLCKFSASYAAEYVFSLASWWLLGRAALTGIFEVGWLMAWILMTFCSLALGACKRVSIQKMSIAAGGLLKQRLIAGAVRLDADSVRHRGSGDWLAQVLETDSLEVLAIGGGVATIAALVELVSAGVLFWLGAGAGLHVLLLTAWLGVMALIVWRQQIHRASWMGVRLEMTGDLIERMNGHRTRLAQEHPLRWHTGEDETLEQYMERSVPLERYAVLARTVIPRLWLITGLLALTPAFVRDGAAFSPAISIAAILLAYRSMQALAKSLGDLTAAGLAWRKVRDLFHAAAQPVSFGVAAASSMTRESLLLEARDLTFRYRERSEPVIHSCNLSIRRGDCVLLEGASGDGKSTLVSLLAGLRKPDSGLLLAGGLDHHSLGEAGWRRRVALVPQSHENHVFSASLAFNLLLSRSWPPSAEDLAEASAVCRDLGLDALIARMPAGLDQIVGESGWQLSEGERSRIFLARALLAKADVLLLDECFGSLDPESLTLSYNALRRRANALLLIAHP